MKEVLVIISSDPEKGYLYEQGIEVALNLSDANIDVAVYVEQDFLKRLDESETDIYRKKLKQCLLFDIEVYSKESLGIDFIKEIHDENFFRNYRKVVTF